MTAWLLNFVIVVLEMLFHMLPSICILSPTSLRRHPVCISRESLPRKTFSWHTCTLPAIPMDCEWEGCDAKNLESLKEHLDEHAKHSTGIECRWRGCPRGGEKLSNKYALQTHMRTHTGEKPFKCTQCSKAFSRQDALNKHIARHASEARHLERAVGRVFYACEVRDQLENETKELLEERQLHLDCLRILQDELLGLDRGKLEDSWEDYL